MSNTEHDHNQPDRRNMNFENKKEQELCETFVQH